ncbi:MAG: type II toxin-antitoxin system VapC family toxin [Chloroflexi bacterium]|nr:type II toxin-antitoxin system VapC family toxin [Chloroflexota bacterium]
MTALIDTGFLYAVLDKGDRNHRRVTHTLSTLSDDLVLPTVVLVELAYLLQARLGHAAMRRFVRQLESSPLLFEPVTRADTTRIYELLEQYSNIELDFVDAAIVTLAERLDIRRILTVDGDFHIIRPRHCDFFQVLP